VSIIDDVKGIDQLCVATKRVDRRGVESCVSFIGKYVWLLLIWLSFFVVVIVAILIVLMF